MKLLHFSAKILLALGPVEPEFLVLPRVAKAASGNPGLALHALEKVAPSSYDEWTFRSG